MMEHFRRSRALRTVTQWCVPVTLVRFIASGMHRPLETYKNGGHVAYDPDDTEDIITTISLGSKHVTRTDRAAWEQQVRWYQRPRLWW